MSVQCKMTKNTDLSKNAAITRAYVTRREGPRRKAIHYACKCMPVQQSHARQTIAIVPVCKVEQV